VERDDNAADDAEAVGYVGVGVVLGFAEREEHGGCALVEQRVPKAYGEDGDHPGGFVVTAVVELEDDEVAPDGHEGEERRADQQDVEAVTQELGAELVDREMDDLGDEGVCDARTEGEHDLAWDVG